jgi:hypothetical protein
LAKTTKKDFTPDAPPWLIEDWFPLGHKGMDTAPEGSFKTIWGCWLAVCIAAGKPVFGMPTYQGNVMIVDEETPKTSLEYHLQRFSEGLGVRYKDLPIFIFSMEGYRFDRSSKMKELIKLVDAIDPVFIRMDSLIAMMPSGTGRLGENSDNIGEIVRDGLNRLLSPSRSILIAAHAKKYIAELSLDELRKLEMQGIVRGHGSIVGEGCDTGYILKKISNNPNPTRFCVMTAPRRQAIPENTIKYIEMVEEEYGKGWARLELIPSRSLPPTQFAKDMYQLFKVPDGRGNFNHAAAWIKSRCAFHTAKECKMGVMELLEHKVIVEIAPQEYEFNQKRGSQSDPEYLKLLEIR